MFYGHVSKRQLIIVHTSWLGVGNHKPNIYQHVIAILMFFVFCGQDGTHYSGGYSRVC
jgi:hypothetical protein